MGISKFMLSLATIKKGIIDGVPSDCVKISFLKILLIITKSVTKM